MIGPYKKYVPRIHRTVFVAPTAAVIGQVEIGAGSSVWFGAVLRGDINKIKVGKGTNIQDNAVLHVEARIPCIVGSRVVIGHQATVHACRVGDGALIGIGARVLNRVLVGEESVVAAGAVVLEGMRIPPRSLVAGVPAKIVRKVTAREIAKNRQNALHYRTLASWYNDHLKLHRDDTGIAFLGDLAGILR